MAPVIEHEASPVARQPFDCEKIGFSGNTSHYKRFHASAPRCCHEIDVEEAVNARGHELRHLLAA